MELLRKYRYIIFPLSIEECDGSFQAFEIPIPANVRRIVTVMLTNNYSGANPWFGKLALQSQDENDLFLLTDLFRDDLAYPGKINMTGFPDGPGISGYRSKAFPVNISGDTALICGWVKVSDGVSCNLKIYLRYEQVEEPFGNETETESQKEEKP